MRRWRLWLLVALVVVVVAGVLAMRGPSYSYVSITNADGSKTEVEASGFGAETEIKQDGVHIRSSAR
jgi:hypothetical protein